MQVSALCSSLTRGKVASQLLLHSQSCHLQQGPSLVAYLRLATALAAPIPTSCTSQLLFSRREENWDPSNSQQGAGVALQPSHELHIQAVCGERQSVGAFETKSMRWWEGDSD